MDESKQILIAVTKLQADFSNMASSIDDIKKIGNMVYENDQRVKSAHNRLDDFKIDFNKKLDDQEKDFKEKLQDHKEDFKELTSHITWLWRTVGAAIVTIGIWVITNFLDK